MNKQPKQKIGSFNVKTAHRDFADLCVLCGRDIRKGDYYIGTKELKCYKCARKERSETNRIVEALEVKTPPVFSNLEILEEIRELCKWKRGQHTGILKNKLNAIAARAQTLVERERDAKRKNET